MMTQGEGLEPLIRPRFTCFGSQRSDFFGKQQFFSLDGNSCTRYIKNFHDHKVSLLNHSG